MKILTWANEIFTSSTTIYREILVQNPNCLRRLTSCFPQIRLDHLHSASYGLPSQLPKYTRVHEAPQASHDKTHAPSWMAPKLLSDKYTQASDHLHAFSKRKHLLGQRSDDAIASLHRPQKKHSPRSEFTPELHRWIWKLTASHLQILHQEII